MTPQEVHEAKRREFGREVVKARWREGITQEVLAKEIGVVQSTIAKIELGYHDARFGTLVKLIRRLNIARDVVLAYLHEGMDGR